MSYLPLYTIIGPSRYIILYSIYHLLIHESELKATQLNTWVLEIVGKDFFFFQNVKIWKKILYVIMELKEIKKNLQEFFFWVGTFFSW